jgi:hypothetical protein
MIMSTILATALLMSPAVVPAGGSPDVKPSTYVGKHYNPAWENWRKCVVWRESRDNPKAANKRSSARGLYQFLDNAWRVSLTHMVMREHKHARTVIIALRDKPIHHWPRFWQDAAFWTVLNDGAGAKHWALQRSACNGLRP